MRCRTCPAFADSLNDAGDHWATGGAIATPVTGMSRSGVTGSLLKTWTFALRTPGVVGAHRRLNSRAVPGGSGNAASGTFSPPSSLASSTKSPAVSE